MSSTVRGSGGGQGRYVGFAAVNPLAVTGGTVVTPDGVRPRDVLISDGKIAAIVEAGSATGPALDATGCYVLPGGVDPHCHLMSQVRLATAAAALGGTPAAPSVPHTPDGQRHLGRRPA